MISKTIIKYDYLEAITQDIKNFLKKSDYLKGKNLKDQDTFDEVFSDLYDEFMINDEITGNGTFEGYPDFDPFMVENNLDLFFKAMREF